TRNTYFRVWSTAAQPAGYPDTIRIVGTPSSPANPLNAEAVVDQGHADVATIGYTAQQDLKRRYPDRVWTSPAIGTHFVLLNTHVPPFNNPLARRAVAYALSDEPAFGKAFIGSPSCTLVPPDWPGQSGGCAGRRNRSKARRLVHRSGT